MKGIYLPCCYFVKTLSGYLFSLFICSFSLVCRWVPIKGNDWFWIRHFIRVGMHVIVEITVLSLFHVDKS